ncbi:MAG: OprO/OprP family phosphate-selective porin [Gammaproteobacteria bacterium]|nr:OprO/OprP family phosphate-selective porin [Gammaproteobacteria bacterium]
MTLHYTVTFLLAGLLFLTMPCVNADQASTKGGLQITSNDGNFSAALGGRIQFDMYAFDADLEDPVSTTDFRRVRITLKGNIYDWSYILEQDFADGSTLEGFRDVYLAKKMLGGSFRIGQFKPFRSMEEMTSANEITMLERAFSSASGLYEAHQFQQGIGWLGQRNNFTLGIMLFNLRDAGEPRTEGFGTAGRFTWAPINSGHSTLHFGFSLSNEKTGRDSIDVDAQANYAGKRGPSQLIALTPGDSGGSVNTAALELGGTYGSVYLQSEYTYGDFDGNYYLSVPIFEERFGAPAPFECDISLGCFIGNQEVRAWYLMGSWMLTGEHKPYDGSQGVFKSAQPARAGGAWELTARYDTIRNRDIHSLRANSWIVGVNYYVNPMVRFMLNFTFGDDLFTDDKTNQLGLRAQIVW